MQARDDLRLQQSHIEVLFAKQLAYDAEEHGATADVLASFHRVDVSTAEPLYRHKPLFGMEGLCHGRAEDRQRGDFGDGLGKARGPLNEELGRGGRHDPVAEQRRVDNLLGLGPLLRREFFFLVKDEGDVDVIEVGRVDYSLQSFLADAHGCLWLKGRCPWTRQHRRYGTQSLILDCKVHVHLLDGF